MRWRGIRWRLRERSNVDTGWQAGQAGGRLVNNAVPHHDLFNKVCNVSTCSSHVYVCMTRLFALHSTFCQCVASVDSGCLLPYLCAAASL